MNNILYHCAREWDISVGRARLEPTDHCQSEKYLVNGGDECPHTKCTQSFITLVVSSTSLVTVEEDAGTGNKAATTFGNSTQLRDVIHLENKPRPTSRWQGDTKLRLQGLAQVQVWTRDTVRRTGRVDQQLVSRSVQSGLWCLSDL